MAKLDALKGVLEQVKQDSAKAFGDKLSRIILYGSCARGDNTPESDVDIMIILDCDFEEIRKFRERAAEISSEIGLKEDVVVSISLRDKRHFDENADFLPFYKNIIKEGVSVYG